MVPERHSKMLWFRKTLFQVKPRRSMQRSTEQAIGTGSIGKC